MTDLLHSALWYVDMGWYVFPCKPRSKIPLTPNGFKNASDDEEQIREWWAKWPDANIGLATGSGIFVLDIDKKHNGFASLAVLEKKHGILPESWTAITGGGGCHVYFSSSEEVRNSTGKVGEGIDIRGDGGYVLLPPSVHESGSLYEWKHPPGELAVAEAPAWLFKTTETKKKKSSRKNLVPEGKRHDFLVSEAGKLRRIGYDVNRIEKNLKIIFEDECEPEPAPKPGTIEQIARSCMNWDPAPHEVTDMGNADRFCKLYEGKALYCTLWHKWLVWDKSHWVKDEMGRVVEMAKYCIKQIQEEAKASKDDEESKRLFAWHLKSQDSHRVAAMLKLSQSQMSIHPDELDRNTWLLNARNGTVDLRRGELREHRPEDRITMVTKGDYAEGDMPRIKRFLGEIFNGSQELIDFVQRLIGYSITGEMGERVFPILWGEGKNGKSTLVNLIQDMLGDYARSTPTKTFLAKNGDQIPNDVARLKGARFVAAQESKEGKFLDTELVKQVTGEDKLQARFLRAEWFEFYPMFKMWMATNYKPKVKADDIAIWDRLILVPFLVRMKKEQQDKNLKKKLRTELPQFLAWCVEGCLAWQREGLNPPEEVLRATEQYREDEDIIADFLEAHCVFEKGGTANCVKLYNVYQAWCPSCGHKPLNIKNFKGRLERRGMVQQKGEWEGISIVGVKHSY